MVTESLRGRSKRHLARTAGFYLSVVVFLTFWLLAFDFQLYALFAAWFDAELADTNHFVHDIALATWVWVWGAAMLVQLYEPAKRVAAMQVALAVTVVDVAVSLAAGVFDPGAMLFFAPVFVAAALHPARGELLGRGTPTRESVDPVVLGLAALAVVPVVLYVVGQLDAQATLTDDHAALDHYATMGYYGLSLVALGLLAGLRTRGRRPAAYGAGLLAAMLGVASLYQPEASALSEPWATVAILWGLVLVVASEVSVRDVASRSGDHPVEDPASAR